MKTIKAWTLNGIYLLIYSLIMPFILYRRIAKGRPLGSFSERWLGLAPRISSDKHCVWFHAVSVGEVNLLDSLLIRLKQRYPDSQFVISTTTATGMRLAKEKYPQYRSFYFPIDFSWAIRNVLRRIAPDLIILTELEVWPNLLAIAQTNTIPVVVINGRLGEKSFNGYIRLKRFVGPMFARLNAVMAQTDEYAGRFIQLGCPTHRVHVCGSIKFDGAFMPPDIALGRRLRESIGLVESDILWVAGSTQDGEESMSARIWSVVVEQIPELRLVIVPRHPHRGSAIQLELSRIGIESVLQSKMVGQTKMAGSAVRRDQILIADTIGELQGWWSLSDIAFVGGSFGDRGGQNMIEPAAAGAAVCFGPNTWNFNDTVDLLLSNDVAVQVQSESQLQAFVNDCASNRSKATVQGKLARELVARSTGAVDTTCDLLNEYFVTQAMMSINRCSKAA